MIDWIEEGRKIERMAQEMKFNRVHQIASRWQVEPPKKHFEPTPAERAMQAVGSALSVPVLPLQRILFDSPTVAWEMPLATIGGVTIGDHDRGTRVYVRPESEFKATMGNTQQQHFVYTALHEFAHALRHRLGRYLAINPEELVAEMSASIVMARLYPEINFDWSRHYLAMQYKEKPMHMDGELLLHEMRGHATKSADAHTAIVRDALIKEGLISG